MTSDRDSRFSPDDEPDDEFDDEEPPRSIFSAAWFRIVLVVLGVAVVGAVTVPYVLDVVNPPRTGPEPRTASAPAPVAPSAPPAPATPPGAPPAPATPSPAPSDATAPAPSAPSAMKSAAPAEGSGPRPSPAPAPATKASEKAPAAVAEPPKQERAKPAVPAPAKREAALKPAPAERVAAVRPAAPTSTRPTEGGDYFVQVGAYKDQDTARRVAARLRAQNYRVDESVKRGGSATAAAPRPASRAGTPAGPDRYDVIVSGGSAADINTKLAAKGLASEPAGDSVRIRPSLPLRDAVALSKDLGTEGLKVQVRRGGGAAAEPAPRAATSGDSGGGQSLYRVRVGGYPDRAAAQAVQRELQGKGYQPFIAKGRE